MSSPAQLAAHRAVWSGVHGNKRLPKALVQDKLVAYFGSRGETVTELELVPDKDNLDAWRAEWDATLLDAEITSAADRLKTIGWLESKGGLRGSVSDQHPTQDRSLSCVARMRGTVAQQVVVPQSAPRYPHAGCPVAFGSCKHVSRILSRQSRGSTELGAISLREIVAQIRKLFCGLRSSRCPVSFVVFHTLFREDVPRSLTL